MNLWALEDPMDDAYAWAGWRGSWTEGGSLCDVCGAPSSRRCPPLILEWESGSNLIGDFTCTGVTEGWAVKAHVIGDLLARFRGFEKSEVCILERKRSSKSGRRRKALAPEAGEELYELWVTHQAHIDLSRSTGEFRRNCSTCGSKAFDPEGVEFHDSKWIPEMGILAPVHRQRVDGMGIFVRREELGNADIFALHERGGVYCTSEFKDFIIQNNYSNIDFIHMGEII
jgi:hypothetical protein